VRPRRLRSRAPPRRAAGVPPADRVVDRQAHEPEPGQRSARRVGPPRPQRRGRPPQAGSHGRGCGPAIGETRSVGDGGGRSWRSRTATAARWPDPRRSGPVCGTRPRTSRWQDPHPSRAQPGRSDRHGRRESDGRTATGSGRGRRRSRRCRARHDRGSWRCCVRHAWISATTSFLPSLARPQS
jgi:hypothetical protein